MTLIVETVAAAAAPLQTDLLRNSVHRQAGYDRMITGAALGGSAAAGDTLIAFFVQDVQVAQLVNIADQAPTGYQMFPVDALVPAGAELRAIVTDAPATNPITLYIEIDEAPEMSGGGLDALVADVLG